MEDLFHPTAMPYVVFFLRVMNNAVGTIRVVMVNREYKVWGFALASLESLMFAYTAGIVLTNLNNVPNLVAYVLGFSVGGYVGMFIERRFLNLYNIIDVIASSAVAHEIATALRDDGHGVTEMYGEGARGEVHQLRIVAHHRETRDVIMTARRIQPGVFITVEESRFIAGGWVRSQHQHHK